MGRPRRERARVLGAGGLAEAEQIALAELAEKRPPADHPRRDHRASRSQNHGGNKSSDAELVDLA
jgi:hypothetical protein